MKNYSRAYNRHKQHVKFVRRVKIWLKRDPNQKEHLEDALKGRSMVFLRTTANPCNCAGCTYLKYKRIPKQKIKKECFEEICSLSSGG